MRFRLLAPLRAKVTSSTRSLALLSKGSRLLILTEPHDELASSLDHLVGAGEQRCRYFDPQGPRGRQIDDEIEFGRLLDWDVGRVRSAENLIDVTRGAPE